MKSSEEQAAEITRSLSREQNYVLMLRPNPNAPKYDRDMLRIKHHEYLIDLERRGILFAAGPFADRGEKPSGSGMLIIRAADQVEATRIGGHEPYTREKIRLMEIIPWQRNEGTLKVEIRFADGILNIDNRNYSLSKVN